MGSEPEVHADGNLVSEDRLQGKLLEHVYTSFIRPSTATPCEKEWLPLSSLDYLWVAYLFFLRLTLTFQPWLFSGGRTGWVPLYEILVGACTRFAGFPAS